MPIATVKCDICGETVNKCRTLTIGDGKRACRIHSETQIAVNEMTVTKNQLPRP